MKRDLGAVLVFSVLFLFFLQLITDFIAGIYAYGVLGTGIPIEIVAIVLFLSPFLLLLFNRGLGVTTLILLGELVLVCRVIEIWLPVRLQMIVAGLGTGLFLFLFPALLWHYGFRKGRGVGRLMATSLVLAVSASVLFRTLGSTMDLTNEGWFRAIAVVIAVGVGTLLPRAIQGEIPDTEQSEKESPKASWGKTIALNFGISAVFLLLYFAFSSPAVITRWAEADYLLILSLAAISLAAFVWLLALVKRDSFPILPVVATIISAGFVLALTLTLDINQTVLPSEPAAYPLLDPGVSQSWNIALVALLLLYPVLFLDFGLLTEETIRARPSMRMLGLGFGLASIFMVIIILANVFTSTWAYIDPILEPLIRFRYWQVFLIVGFILMGSMLVVRATPATPASETSDLRTRKVAAGLVTAICLGIIAGAFFLDAEPSDQAKVEQLVVAGFNLQQGYDVDGQRSHKAQCELLDKIDADIIALSESDTARIAGGNFDIVRYLATCLDMNSYVGPKTGIGTFGYALLSKYPIENPETVHLFSAPGLQSSDDPDKVSGGDQVALTSGTVEVAGKRYNVIVVHFDSNPPEEQPQGLVKVISGQEDVIAIGDYNCKPGTSCFEIISDKLEHCARSSGNMDLVEGHIDHIFVSPGIECENFRYVETETSDHPVVVANIVR